MDVDHMAAPRFDDAFGRQLLTLMRWRRDVRRFRADPVDPALIDAFIDAARLAPSVGYSQPWRFVLVESAAARTAMRTNFTQANARALAGYVGERAAAYSRLKLEGLDQAPVQFAVFTDTQTQAGHGLGSKTMPQTLHYSSVMAIYAFWLAARVAEVGVGWVSILDPQRVHADLAAMPGWDFTAYLCIGYPDAAFDTPELARVGWQQALDQPRIALRR
jgi:5,6-dimethylbenzimidazole synthase